MYNQIEAILSQYELEIHGVAKGRSAFICDTNKGKKLLLPFRGSKEKGMILYQFLAELVAQGFSVEQIELTKQQEAISEDEYTGERFILKSYMEGIEISTSRPEEMKQAIQTLAIYHNTVEKLTFLRSEYRNAETTIEIWKRHSKELIKVRNYIRNRKKKNEFEQIFMKNFEHNLKSAEKSIEMLEQEGESEPRYVVCHGDVNQHNILLCNGKCQMVNFENVYYNWAVVDLANFIRKMLEKNEWDNEIGKALILEYHRIRPLQKEEYQKLYALLLFPEKFWKVTNHYMNSRKSFISERDIDKLKKVIELEERRLNFMENLFAFLE